MRAQQIGLLICLIVVGYIITVAADDAHAGNSFVVLAQASPLSSPITMVQSTLQSSKGSSPEMADSAQAFRQQLPIYSGSQANQTSLVLIGALFLGLVVVGVLVINRE